MRLVQAVLPGSRAVRVLTVSTLGRSVGHGILVTVSVLYFTRQVGIAAGSVGLGLTVASVLAMLASIPTGHLADVLGARTASIVFVVLQGVTMWGYAVVGGFAGFVVAASLAAMAEAAGNAARGALVATAVPAGERVRTRAYLRSVTNIGTAVGTLLGGLALGHETQTAYRIELLGGGVMFVLAGLVYFAIPHLPPVPRPAQESRLGVLRDRPFVAISLLNAVLIMNSGILGVALPIWIAQRTHAPTSLFAALLLVNMVLVVLFQVRVSRGAEDVAGGARAMHRCGLWLAACCLVFAAAAGQPAWVAAVVLVVGVVVHTIGELLYSAGSWALSYELAPDHAQGQYQGMFGMATALGAAVTPAVTTLLIVGIGWLGWVVLAALLATAGLVTPVTARWAERTRPPAPEPAPAGGDPGGTPPARPDDRTTPGAPQHAA